MGAIDTTKYYDNLSGLTDKSTPSVRKMTSSSSGDTVTSTGDTSLFSTSEAMGKQDFLNLLVTQLKYQDPLQPTDNTEYVAQLAQFSELENMQNVSDAVDTLTENMNTFMTMQTLNSQSMTNSSATPLLGKEVRVAKADLVHEQGKTDALKVTLEDSYRSGTLEISDSKGNVVARVPIEAKEKGGDAQVEWNGKGTDGTSLASGSYTLSVLASDGKTTAGYVYDEGVVKGVSFNSTGATLSINGKSYGLGRLLNVKEAET